MRRMLPRRSLGRVPEAKADSERQAETAIVNHYGPADWDWMPVIGGPRGGAEYLPSTRPKPGSLVHLNEYEPEHRTGLYRVAADGMSVVWHPYQPPVRVPGLSFMRPLARREGPAADPPADVGRGE
jgi:hypothetical protein